MPVANPKYPVKTKVFIDNGHLKMVYHDTVVCDYSVKENILILNTGGYFTATTKRRMNQFLSENNFDLEVINTKKGWAVRYLDNSHICYFNGFDFMIIYNAFLGE